VPGGVVTRPGHGQVGGLSEQAGDPQDCQRQLWMADRLAAAMPEYHARFEQSRE
jgi:hypothetical protein